MHYWAAYLAATPPTLLRLIASAQRVSLPRRSTPAERLQRVRRALCRARAVRERYFALPPAVQAAAQDLRRVARGLSPTELAARLGPIRPLTELRRDRRPQSLAEQLLLLGWLLPRPATPRHPLRYLMPPEVRAWLPVPLATDQPAPCAAQAADAESACCSLDAPACRAAEALLLAAARAPLPLRRDGTPTRAALRRLQPLLQPLAHLDCAALLAWITPLLVDLGLLAPHGAAAAPTAAARGFFQRPAAQRLAQLQAAWLRSARAEAWLLRLRVSTQGLDWPALRRRLLAWAAAMPDAIGSDSYHLLAAAFGPLGDAHTHGLCAHERAPWQERGARAVWAAALDGPLAWLGAVRQVDCRTGDGCRPVAPDPQARSAAWVYGAPGEVLAPRPVAADLFDLAPAAATLRAEDDHVIVTLSEESLAAAAAAGYAPALLHNRLAQRAGPPPPAWADLLEEPAPARMIPRLVLISEQPCALATALRRPTVRRRIETQLAPGVALVAPGQEAALSRALTRAGHAVAVPPATASLPAELSPADRAALLAACTFYRTAAPPAAHPGPSDWLLERLRAGLPPGLAARLEDTSRAEAWRATGTGCPDDAAIHGRPGVAWRATVAGCPGDTAIHGRPGNDNYGRRQAPALGGALLTAAVTLLPTLLGSVVALAADMPSPPPSSAAPPVPAPAARPPADPAAGAERLAVLREAIRRRRAATLHYRGINDRVARRRLVQPLRLERHGAHWYLHAYCTQAGAERCFRLDRIECLTVATEATVRPRGRPPGKRPPRGRSSVQRPRTGFFSAPPPPLPDSPLVRVWLEEI